MKILILEDEEQAGKRLIRILSKLLPDAEVHGPLETVSEAIKWFKANQAPDLAFFDIHLGDGLSFEVGEAVPLECPVIFTTAYDQYALRAFELNSVDYLLKPIEEDALAGSLEKYRNRYLNHPARVLGTYWPEQLTGDYRQKYKERFVSRIGEKIQVLEVREVLFAYSENKATYLRTSTDKNFLVDYNLEQLEGLLDPQKFFRLNRKYIARLEAVDSILAYSNSRVKVRLKNWPDDDVVLSRERTRDFKSWLDR